MSFDAEPRGWRRTRHRVLARDGRICWLCGKPGANSVDHVIPRIHGGSHADSNLRAAHLSCNSRKGDTLPDAPPRALPRARPSRW